MQTDDRDEPSHIQEAWVHIAAKLRCKLAGRLDEVERMAGFELTAYVKALDDAYWFEFRAQLHDRRLETELNRSTFD
jgi:hypothetical protein